MTRFIITIALLIGVVTSVRAEIIGGSTGGGGGGGASSTVSIIPGGATAAAVKGASTAAAAADSSLVVNESPNSQTATAVGAAGQTAGCSAASSSSLIQCFYQFHTDLTSAIPAGNNTIGNVNGAPNVTPTDCSGTITTGGTAQNAIAASTTIHGIQIQNIDAAAGGGEVLWFSLTGTAAASAAGSYGLIPPSGTSTQGGAYNTPVGLGSNKNFSVVAATTGHKYSCTSW